MSSTKDLFPRNRLEALTDGIYAVALTLLVLDLKIPAGLLGSEQIAQALRGQLPNLLAWVLSFWVILIYWESQVRLNRRLEEADTTILRFDLLHLGLISLLPFSTSMISEYGSLGLVALIYTGNLWAISALFVIKTSYIQTHRDIIVGNTEMTELANSSKRMLIGMTLALLLAYVIPGWNLLAVLVPKLIQRK